MDIITRQGLYIIELILFLGTSIFIQPVLFQCFCLLPSSYVVSLTLDMLIVLGRWTYGKEVSVFEWG